MCKNSKKWRIQNWCKKVHPYFLSNRKQGPKYSIPSNRKQYFFPKLGERNWEEKYRREQHKNQDSFWASFFGLFRNNEIIGNNEKILFPTRRKRLYKIPAQLHNKTNPVFVTLPSDRNWTRTFPTGTVTVNPPVPLYCWWFIVTKSKFLSVSNDDDQMLTEWQFDEIVHSNSSLLA